MTVLPPPQPVQLQVYKENRAEIMSGDPILFGYSKRWISRLIQFFTRSPYHHVGIAYVFNGRVYCLEAIGSGVSLRLMSEIVKHTDAQIEFYHVRGNTPEIINDVIDFCFRQLGKRYDKVGLFRFLWYIFFKVKSSRGLNDEWFCSEYVAQAYIEAGNPIVEHNDARYTSPAQIKQSEQVILKFVL